jgi:hypothetical protein
LTPYLIVNNKKDARTLELLTLLVVATIFHCYFSPMVVKEREMESKREEIKKINTI